MLFAGKTTGERTKATLLVHATEPLFPIDGDSVIVENLVVKNDGTTNLNQSVATASTDKVAWAVLH